MVDIIKKRVIDWDNQLRKEKHFNEKFGTNLSPSCVKELTGSFRRLTEKSKNKIGDGTLEQCEEFYLSLDLMKQNQLKMRGMVLITRFYTLASHLINCQILWLSIMSVH